MSAFQTHDFVILCFIIDITCLTILPNSLAMQYCKQRSDCKFTCTDIPSRGGDVDIDLSTVDSKAIDLPRFPKISSDDGQYVYSWNPCTRFTLTGSSCVDVNVCQQGVKNPDEQFNAGSSLSMYYDRNADKFVMKYYGSGGRVTYAKLVYEDGEEGRVSEVKEAPKESYSFTLYTEYAPQRDDDSGGGISTGTVMLIIFFTVLVLYVGIGIFWNHRKGAQGKDKIPNYEFWSKIPGLAKDGCIFSANKAKDCFSTVREKTTKEQGNKGEYEKI